MSTYASDTFPRTVGSGWGTASDGVTTYTTSGSPTLSVVNGSGGKITGIAAFFGVLFGSNTPADVDITLTFQASALGDSPRIVARWLGSGTQYRAGWNGSGNFVITKNVSGTTTTLATTATNYTINTNTSIRFLVVGSSLSAKFWTGGSEPSAWTLTATDSAITQGGNFGFSAQPGATGHTIFVSSYTATDGTVSLTGRGQDTFVTATAIKGRMQGKFPTRSPRGESVRATFHTTPALKGISRGKFSTAYALKGRVRGTYGTEALLRGSTRSTYSTTTVLRSRVRSLFVQKSNLSNLTRAAFFLKAGLGIGERTAFITATALQAKGQDRFYTRAGLSLRDRAKFITTIVFGPTTKHSTVFNIRNTASPFAQRTHFQTASILTGRTREIFQTRFPSTLLSRSKEYTAATLNGYGRTKFLSAIALVGRVRDTLSVKIVGVYISVVQSAFAIQFLSQQQPISRFPIRIMGMAPGASRVRFRLLVALKGRVHETFKVYDIAGLLHLTSLAESHFQSRAVFLQTVREKFLTRAGMISLGRVRFWTRMPRSMQVRGRFSLRIPLAHTYRSRFLTRFSTTSFVRTKAFTSAVLSSRVRGKFWSAAAFKSRVRILEVIRAGQRIGVHATFFTRYRLGGIGRDAFFTRAGIRLLLRTKFVTALVLHVQERVRFVSRMGLRNAVQQTFRTKLSGIGTQLQENFSTRFPMRGQELPTFHITPRIQTAFRVPFRILNALHVRLSERFLVRMVPRPLKVVASPGVSQYSVSYMESFGMANPYSSTLSTAKVVDIYNVAQSDLVSVSVVVSFPDGSQSTYNLSNGISNVGGGSYQLSYTTKGPGMHRELWTFLAGDTSTAQYTNITPVSY